MARTRTAWTAGHDRMLCMSDEDDVVSAAKLDNGLFTWIAQPDSGAFYQGGKHFKTRAAALKAGQEFAAQLR